MRALFVFVKLVCPDLAAPLIKKLREKGWFVTVLNFGWIWRFVEWVFRYTFWSSKIRGATLKKLYVARIDSERKIHRFKLFEGAAKFLVSVAKLFHVQKPDVIVYYTKSYATQILILMGKHVGVPSVLPLHRGLVGENYGKPKFLADKIAVMGPYGKKILTQNGFNEDRIAVTGRPIYDAILRTHYIKWYVCTNRSLNPFKKIVLYCTENFPLAESQKNAYAVCKAVKQLPLTQLLIFVHHEEKNLQIYRAILKQLNMKALIIHKEAPFRYFAVCDVLVTGYSTTALDAMVMGKPAITYNFTEYKSPIPYAEQGATIGVFDQHSLLKALKEVLYDEEALEKLKKSWPNFVYEHAYKQDGKACQRVIELMESLC